MPMLRRAYGAVKKLCCKSGARFPPSIIDIQKIKEYISY